MYCIESAASDTSLGDNVVCWGRPSNPPEKGSGNDPPLDLLRCSVVTMKAGMVVQGGGYGGAGSIVR